MMLARVADSLYWAGRYVERAEHHSRLAEIMLNATLDRSSVAERAALITAVAAGEPARPGQIQPLDLARRLVLDKDNFAAVVESLSRARENARQVRDQITTESWERLNLLYLRVTSGRATSAFAADPVGYLAEILADLHLFKGAADSTMSHGEGWRFMMTGVYLERALLMARLLRAAFGGSEPAAGGEPLLLAVVLRMACALEPYLRAYTADLTPRYILEFLLFDEDFPRSIRFSAAQIEQHLSQLSRARESERSDSHRRAGRLNARLAYADTEEALGGGGLELLEAVERECRAIHQAMHDTFVAYPLETRLPA